jgi:C1A family cysteine protease
VKFFVQVAARRHRECSYELLELYRTVLKQQSELFSFRRTRNAPPSAEDHSDRVSSKRVRIVASLANAGRCAEQIVSVVSEYLAP